MPDIIGYKLVSDAPFLKPGEVAICTMKDCAADEYTHFSGEAAQKLADLQAVTPERDWQMILCGEVQARSRKNITLSTH